MVSIIIPSYNRADTIGYCLESVINQTYSDFECLVVDYCENDDSTMKIVNLFSTKDHRIVYVKSPVKGAMAQREYGIKISKGDYICFIDSDDFVHEKYVEYLYKSLISTGSDFSFGKITEYESLENAKRARGLQNDNISFYKVTNKQYRDLIKKFRKNLVSPVPYCLLAKKETFVEACKWYNSSLHISCYEDAILSYYIWFNNKSVTLVNDIVLYYYIGYKRFRPNNNVSGFIEDCYNVSYYLDKIIRESNYPEYIDQSTYYGVIGVVYKIINSSPLKKKQFQEVRKDFRKYVVFKNIKPFSSDYHFSESLIALSVKYNLFFLVYLVMLRRKLL